MGNGRTPLFSALVHMEEPLSPVGVAVPQKVNWNGFSVLCMGPGECEHVEADPAPIKEEGWGPGIMAHLLPHCAKDTHHFLQVKLTVMLFQ